jgi:isocitrate/isopropylmalate dehydrogenase
MASYKILLLPGDGIGPEVTAEVEKVAKAISGAGLASFEFEKGLVGGCAYDAHGQAISEADMALAQSADAVMLAAVGGPKWDHVPYDVRPEAGLLRLRKDLGLFANLRPAVCYPALADASALKREIVEGLDIMIVRELTGGVYFGEPKEIIDLGNGQKRGIDTQVYDTYEIERISAVAFELARKRGNKVGRIVEGGRHRPAQARLCRRQAGAHAGRRAGHAAGALAQAVRRHRHRQSVRRHALRCRLHAHGVARHAAVRLIGRSRRQWPPQGDV